MSNNVYRLWPGNNRFFCHGKLMTGPDIHRAVLTFALILFPGGLLSFPAAETDYLFVILNIIFLLSVIVLFFFSALTNPGYIPKQVPPFAKGPKDAPTMYLLLQTEMSKPSPFQGQQVTYPMLGRYFRLKYCHSCTFYIGLILRPPRCSHCYDCGLCVERFDHHCPWIGNCIGKRNYRFFYMFIIALSLYSLFGLFVCFSHVFYVTQREEVFEDALSDIGVSLALLLFNLPFLCFSIGLTIFHTYILLRNETTKETLKRVWKGNNPYSLSLWRNFTSVFAKLPFIQFKTNQMSLSNNLYHYQSAISQEAISKFNIGNEELTMNKIDPSNGNIQSKIRAKTLDGSITAMIN